jgi:hypothetical protein
MIDLSSGRRTHIRQAAGTTEIKTSNPVVVLASDRQTEPSLPEEVLASGLTRLRVTDDLKALLTLQSLLDQQFTVMKEADLETTREVSALILTHIGLRQTSYTRLASAACAISPAARRHFNLLMASQLCEDRCVVLSEILVNLSEVDAMEAEILKLRCSINQHTQDELRLQARKPTSEVAGEPVPASDAWPSCSTSDMQFRVRELDAKLLSLRSIVTRRVESLPAPVSAEIVEVQLAALDQCLRSVVDKDKALGTLARKIRVDVPEAPRLLIEISARTGVVVTKLSEMRLPSESLARPVQQLLDIRDRRTRLAGDYSGLQRLAEQLRAQYADRIIDHDYAQAERARQHHLENMQIQTRRLERVSFADEQLGFPGEREELLCGKAEVDHTLAALDAAVARLERLRARSAD